MKKDLLYFVGGIIVGGATGGFVSYILTKQKYEKKINEELDRLKDQNQKDIETAKKEAIDDISEEHLIVKKPTLEEIEEEEKVLTAATSVDEKSFVNYSSFYSEKEEPNGDDACDEDVDYELYPVEDEARIPYFIDEDAIDASYDIVCLTYYEKDQTLSDDVSAQVVLPEETISKRLLERFIESDEDQTYICRDSHSTVYEVTRYGGSYREEVLGLLDDYGGVEDGGDIDT